MQAPQLAGFGVTIAVVIGADLPLDWLIPVAMLCGGVATFAVDYFLRSRR